MKYIMFEVKIAEVIKRVPIIFPDALVHREVALSLSPLIRNTFKSGVAINSAGTIHLEDVKVSGGSETLDVLHDEKDEDIINYYSYLHGIVE